MKRVFVLFRSLEIPRLLFPTPNKWVVQFSKCERQIGVKYNYYTAFTLGRTSLIPSSFGYVSNFSNRSFKFERNRTASTLSGSSPDGSRNGTTSAVSATWEEYFLYCMIPQTMLWLPYLLVAFLTIEFSLQLNRENGKVHSFEKRISVLNQQDGICDKYAKIVTTCVKSTAFLKMSLKQAFDELRELFSCFVTSMAKWKRQFAIVLCEETYKPSSPNGTIFYGGYSPSSPETLKETFNCHCVVYAKQIAANNPIEDRFCVKQIDYSGGNAILTAVIDGHGGWLSAEFLKRMLGEYIEEAIRTEQSCEDNGYMQKVYLKLDNSLKEFLRSQYKEKTIRSGACCIAVLFDEKNYLVANTGDCMAVLCRAGKAFPLSKQHNADIPVERKKVLDAHPEETDAVVCRQSWIAPKTPQSLWEHSLKHVGLLGLETLYSGCYVKNVLNITRSFGDFHLKDEAFAYDSDMRRYRIRKPFSYPYITAFPEVTQCSRTSADDFIIIGSDGLWDFFSPDEAVSIVKQHIHTSVESAAEALVQKVYAIASDKSGVPIADLLQQDAPFRRRYYDDLTVCIINFSL
ncbi:protein phosphatase 2C domain-containing protein [Cardiosporidium cionae]|uniref:Protein phosphatase 2C domain-containing protein n=1 Tax=Cardiosporidium cionae TaxID=476202 RepID=A0ABQ7J4J2_9APIC|nr:protein phosphatase 2C domain-containing protein [Cardiosporidium cionae]|eukprot:KAF8818009.1 protein phosphatase 2C domain-containing protein [Cardiosporidium cionae]